MGIYPKIKWEHDESGNAVRTRTEPGLTRVTVYQPLIEIEERDDCYCCSCASGAGGDPFCRNHGFAGERPCDRHGMPGAVDDEGVMPISVQAYRLTHAERIT